MKRALVNGTLFIAALSATGLAHANGLADLKAALVRGAVGTPVRALVETTTWRKIGEGKDADEDRGAIVLNADDGPRGLVVTHGSELLARIDADLGARAKNPNAKTPALYALDETRPRDLLAFTSAAAAMSRTLERGVFKGERADSYQGKPARALRFEMPISTLSTRDRKYAKEFTSTYEVWIGADGTPVASRMRQAVKGRAFVVVAFESMLEEDTAYALAGARLVAVRKQSRNTASGAGERDERKVVTALQLQP